MALASTGLSGCGLLDGSSRVQEALEYLPADATTVVFIDRAATAERLDVDDIETGASEDDLDRWSEAVQDEAFNTQLSRSARDMQDAAFSEFDVEWEALSTSEESFIRVWKLQDDTDFDAIADDLEDAGYDRTTKDDAEVFEISFDEADADDLFGGRYPITMSALTVVPDEHLVVFGVVDEVLGVVTDEDDSLADAGRFDTLLDEAPDQDDLEYARLSIDPECGIGFFAAADEPLAVVRLFNTDEEATDDENSLATYLERSAQDGLDVDFDVQADGTKVVVEADFDDRRALTHAWSGRDGPFACAPR